MADDTTTSDDRTNIPRVKMNDPFDDKPDFNMGGVMSSPFGRANSTPQANPALRIKRSHSDALGVLKEEHGRESKSRRTSPTDTPSEDKKKKPYNMDKNGFIDLVSDDEEDQSAIDRFVKGQRMLEKRAEREKRDRKMAEQLQRQSGNGSSSSNASKPPAPSAFARMMGVRSGSQAQNSQPASADTPATGPAAIVLGDSDDSELEVIPRSQFSPNDMRRNMTYPTSTPTGPPAVAAAYNPFATGASRVPYTAPSTGVAAASNPSRPTYAPYMPLNQRGIVKAEGGIFADPSLTIRHAGSPIFTGYATQSSQLPGSNPAAAIAGLPGAGFPRGPYDRANVADELGNAIMNGSSLYSRSLANDIMDFVNNPAKTEEQIRDLIENISPDMEMPKEDRQGTPEGMKYPLYEHQKIALTWMSKTECGSNKGGILADDMGLGKTISTLALMLSRTSPTRARKTTLIVAPVALLRQWDSEIHTKLKHGHKLSVFTYHSGKKASYEQLRNYDVVLTTYGTLGSEYKKCESFQARKLAHPSINLNSNEFQSKLPFLGEKSKWYRIVLDEAQNIKNKATKAAMGALHLKADFRWCLTGTPMMNGTHELFSLLRFLRIKPYNDQAAFNQAFGILTKGIGAKAGLERAMRRLQALLKSIMLRRSKNTVVDGKPIITLPEKTEEIVHAIFDEDQQNYYTSLESKSRAVFNKYHKAGTIGKNYSSILLLLLRLRQAACHPHLIMDLEEAPGQASTEFMVDMAKKLPESAVTRLKAATVPFECPVCYDPLTNPIFTLDCCHHACMECLAKITSEFDPNADNGEDRASNAKCPSCRKSISLSRIIDYTSFRIAHMGLVDPATKVEEDDSDSDTDSDDDSDDEASDDDDDANGNIRDFIVEDGVDDIETASSVDEDDDLDVKPRVEVKKKFKLEPLDSSDEDIEAPERPSRKAKVKREINEEDDMDVDDDDLDRKIKDDFEFKDDDYLPEPQEVLRRLAARGKHPLDKDEEEYSDSDVPIRQPRRKSKTALTRPSNKDNKKAAKKAVKPAEKKERREKGPKEDYKDPAKHLNLAQMKKDSRKNNEARRKYMRYLKKNFVTSAKIDKLMEILRATPEDTKTIVFSQFTTLLDLCEVPLREEDFGMGRYDGGMTAEHRYQAVEEFTRNPRQRVLLVSLKAGNAGLNLVAASQVIIIDPFWYVQSLSTPGTSH